MCSVGKRETYRHPLTQSFDESQPDIVCPQVQAQPLPIHSPGPLVGHLEPKMTMKGNLAFPKAQRTYIYLRIWYSMLWGRLMCS